VLRLNCATLPIVFALDSRGSLPPSRTESSIC
jgi:hypothetical protein